MEIVHRIDLSLHHLSSRSLPPNLSPLSSKMSEIPQTDLDTSVTPSKLGSDESSNESRAVEPIEASTLKPLNDPNSSTSLNQQDDSGTAEESTTSIIHLKHSDEEEKDQDEGEEAGQKLKVNEQIHTQDAPALLQSTEPDVETEIQDQAVETSTIRTEELKEELKKQADQAPERGIF